MLEAVDFRQPRVIVELGPGTGVMTRELLRRMTPDSRLFALEVNPRFVKHLRERCSDRRLTVLHADACELAKHLRAHDACAVDAVVSSLGLTSMPEHLRSLIVNQAESCLAEHGVLTQFQYFTSQIPLPNKTPARNGRFCEKTFLGSYFLEIQTKHVLLNFPPAVVFTCRKQAQAVYS
jgi:phospholipid N-methyltransferase